MNIDDRRVFDEIRSKLDIYVTQAAEKVSRKTGLTLEFCRGLVIHDMAKMRGLVAPGISQQTKSGESPERSGQME